MAEDDAPGDKQAAQPADPETILAYRVALEGRRDRYFVEWYSLASSQMASAIGLNATTAVFSSMALRTMLQFNAAAVLGAPAVVLSTNTKPEGSDLALFALGLAFLFASLLGSMIAAVWTYASHRRLFPLFEADYDLYRHNTVHIFGDDRVRKAEHVQRRKELETVREKAAGPMTRAVSHAFAWGWGAFGFLIAGVALIGVSIFPDLGLSSPIAEWLGFAG